MDTIKKIKSNIYIYDNFIKIRLYILNKRILINKYLIDIFVFNLTRLKLLKKSFK